MDKTVSSRKLQWLFGVCLLSSGLVVPGIVQASVVTPWVGNADYTQAPGATGDEDNNVGPFSTYAFSSGVVLITPDTVATQGQFTVGDTYTGYYQSAVQSHDLNGSAVSSPNLNSTYELTVATTFDEQVTSVDASGNAFFSITGGSASLYFDTNPDHNFSSDSGFTNGASIITGSVSGGDSAYVPTPGVGFDSINLSIDSLGYDHNVYTPDTIAGGDGVFTLQLNPSGITSGVTSVMGNTVGLNDLLLQSDGNLNLVAVPLPGTFGLLGGAVVWMLGFGRRPHNDFAQA